MSREDVAWQIMEAYRGRMPFPNIYTGSNTSNITFTNTIRTFDSEVHDLARRIAELVISKQHDYGQSNIMDAPFGPEVGITVRLWDKVARLKNLTENSDKKPKNENIEDTYMDIIGYALLGLMVRNGTFTLPLKLEKNDDTDSVG